MSGNSLAQGFEPQRHVSVGSTEIAYRQVGNGPVIMLLHGWPVHSATWRALAARLARRYTCIVPDLPGHGGSSWSEETDFSFPGLARAMSSFAEALHVGRYIIVANDCGGVVARYMARDDRGSIRGLVLLNTSIPGHRSPEIPFYTWCAKLPGAVFLFRHLLHSRAFLRSDMGYGRCFDDHRLIDGDWIARFVRPLYKSRERLQGVLHYMRAVDWSAIDELATIHPRLATPCKLVWGAQDETFPVEHAREMVPQFASCDGLAAIDGARLLVHEEKPDEVAVEVVEFCASHGWC